MIPENNTIDGSLILVKHRKKLNISISILLILLGMNYRPIDLTKLSLYRIFLQIVLIYSIIFFGRVYKTINQQVLSKTFLYSFRFNLLGLIIISVLEYGEASFYKAFTFQNLAIQIILTPLFFILGSLFKDIKLIDRN